MKFGEALSEIGESELETIQRCNALFARSDAVSILRNALKSGAPERWGALVALRYAPRSVLIELFSDLFQISLETNDQVGMAHEIMFRLGRETLDKELSKHVMELMNRDHLTWEEFRRVCALLDKLGYPDLIRIVIARASESEDPDIAEVVEDYGNL